MFPPLAIILLAASSVTYADYDANNLSSDDTPTANVADNNQPPDFSQSEQITIGEDRNERMTVDVGIPSDIELLSRDKGPYKFIIDTAAQRTVLSTELAQSLELEVEKSLTITTLSGTSSIDTVYVPELTLGARSKLGIIAPTFEKTSLGADGILGLDSLQNQQVLFDFKAEEISVRSDQKRFSKTNSREIIVRARRRDGQLIFTNATIGGVKVNVIIDTGSEVSIGNNALQKRLRIRDSQLTKTELTDVQGIKVPAHFGLVNDFRLGRARFATVPLAFSDIATFDVLNLNNRPALFLGMDALRKFDRIAIDFADKRIYFLLPENVQPYFENTSKF